MDMQCVCGHYSLEHALTHASGCRIKTCGCSRFVYVGTAH